ncbi:hypothetical protein IAR55_001189 [Kwoniella newhampshirensis]|uniref:Translationally-controlled tumor protein homolog n=1 Tax=Kwoniella newhampshirensis TaxID=1651941 RepID=A0AAW0Z4X4_9TREE
MLIYQDVITGDEMASDAFPIKEVDDIAYEVDCAMIVVKEGANPSAEEEAEALEAGATQAYLTYLKGYMKAVKAHLEKTNPDRVAAFEKGAQAFAKKIVGNFKDYEFYIGEGMDPEGMVALLNYREDGVTPYFTLWKDGVKEVKI